ncbi:Fanconi anemia core complex-associated protein 100 [Halichoeres trimaculatus]|uniref:Fanconi anemia core complex-associated protein 100 n=1 Tax=Halichoeres trimaculatus TaxID=147232 RepID=UPI003D9EF2C1
MNGRCTVENWAEFGSSGTSCCQRLLFVTSTVVSFGTGSNEVYLFCTERRKLTGVLQFPGPVSDLVGSHDNKFLFVACQSGVYCVCVQSVLSRASDDASSSPAEIQISSELLVVPEEGILSLFFEGSILLTLSQRDVSWVLTLYRSLKQSKPSNFEMLGSFSLPVIPGVTHNDSERKTGTRRRPVLMCVRSSDTTHLSSSSSTNSVSLEHVLFKLLFGIDAALAKSPVILCGLPDGRLCFLPLYPSGTGLRVLHSLEQPVIFMGAASVEERTGHAQCLVAVGEEGRVVLMGVNKGGAEGGGYTAGFTEGCVPGPVVCGCVEENCLYYSTVSDLLALDLSERLRGIQKEEKASSMKVAVFQNITSLNVCRVVALADPTRNTAGESQLLALSERGTLQRIILPVRKQDATSSSEPSTHSGRSVRELLSAIGDVCERASVLKSTIKSKNQILMHLNQVLNISYLLTACKNNNQHLPIQEKPIRCHAMTSWSRLLQKDSLNLICVLENPGPYVLERGWTLSITVSTLSYPPSTGGGRSSSNFSFPFQGLHPGESLEVSLPLSAAADTSFPMTVSCSIVFSLLSLLGEEAGKLPDPQSSCISLSLNTLTVDWLHTLQVDCPKATRATAQSDSTAGTILTFINSHQRRLRGKGEGGEGALKSESEKYSAAVRVSSELLKETLVSKTSAEDTHQNVSLSLLDWLLSEPHGGVKREQHGDRTPAGSSAIHARGPNGHSVKLTTKEVNVKEDSIRKEDSLNTVEVQIESSSLATVCGLHHAVLCRVQTLVQRASGRAVSKKSIETLALRETLQRAESLLQHIQQSRISEEFSAEVSGGHSTRSLLRVYRDLRENPLFII